MMPMSTDSKRQAVGMALRQARETRGVSLSELSRKAQVAKATLSGLEAGSANPTLETLWALCAALDVPLGELLAAPVPTEPLVVRAGKGKLVRGDAVTGHLVQSFESGGQRHELYDLQVRMRRQISPAHGPGVEEHIVVTGGLLRVGPEAAPLELAPGDYLRLHPTFPHLYQGLAAGTRMVLTMVYPRPRG
jgi:transcriptional regulator with XRE-family HTH domain